MPASLLASGIRKCAPVAACSRSSRMRMSHSSLTRDAGATERGDDRAPPDVGRRPVGAEAAEVVAHRRLREPELGGDVGRAACRAPSAPRPPRRVPLRVRRPRPAAIACARPVRRRRRSARPARPSRGTSAPASGPSRACAARGLGCGRCARPRSPRRGSPPGSRSACGSTPARAGAGGGCSRRGGRRRRRSPRGARRPRGACAP